MYVVGLGSVNWGEEEIRGKHYLDTAGNEGSRPIPVRCTSSFKPLGLSGAAWN